MVLSGFYHRKFGINPIMKFSLIGAGIIFAISSAVFDFEPITNAMHIDDVHIWIVL